MTARHIRKKKKHPLNMAMVNNRGWYKNKKNGKIHFFDNRGFTPSLHYLKNTKELENFVKHLEPWDAKQLTLEIFQKNISKKKKDWITENAALAFSSIGNYANAGTIIKERIEKRPINLRMWDLLAVIALRSADEQVKATQRELMAKFSNNADKRLAARLGAYDSEAWQTKIKNREFKWNNLKI